MIAQIENILVNVVAPLLLIGLGFFIGRYNERRHRRSLRRREGMPGAVLTNLEALPGEVSVEDSWFCIGSVVIASDYYKYFGASLKTLVGGRLRTLETLLERGRREAMLRLREEASRKGADLVLNVRLETAIVMRPAVEVLAYGTAVKLNQQSAISDQQSAVST